VVRRLSLASLNAAIQNKPHLVTDRLATLQPLLFQETVVKPELQRSVMMGPFKSEFTGPHTFAGFKLT
jgi:cullin-associated NEDD8-dissociated protein 1